MYGKLTFLAAGTLLGALALSSPASALTMKECSTKYQAAKTDGSAKDMKWNDYRAKFCGADAAAADKQDEDDVVKTTEKEPEKSTVKAPKSVTFPKAVDKKYASETPAKGRLKTCVDSYHVNKEAGTLADLKWIQKGGGYWSLCNTALKGGA
ncbi:hypothetical protein J2X76_001858 [Neorhizobium sp. 2083]|uniref:hypothetical protein n=1 Tax=Neorhizobium sp. 2083 TaxID=2817762 RepID=UPI000DDDD1D6|nr:hypothetical protein [Neorhizobium sp. 2083]MDR6816685.1 hypothetical protein [Neorhizobium sp. 2083]